MGGSDDTSTRACEVRKLPAAYLGAQDQGPPPGLVEISGKAKDRGLGKVSGCASPQAACSLGQKKKKRAENPTVITLGGIFYL